MRKLSIVLCLAFLVAGCSSGSQQDGDALQGLGYLSGYEKAPENRGVVVHHPDSVYSGYTLYQSSHAPTARLIDMEGDLVHQWKVSYREAFGDSRPKLRPNLPIEAGDWWFDAFHLYPDGDLLAVFPLVGMVKLDENSNVQWSRLNHAHHEIATDGAGRIYVLEKEAVTDVNYWHGKWYEISDRLTVYTPDGSQKIASYSMYDALKNSKYRGLLTSGDWKEHDLLHANNFAFIPSNHYLKEKHGADLLVSLRRISSIVGLDTDTKSVVWATTGKTVDQHDPKVWPDGSIALFDNGTIRKQSRIVTLNPRTRQLRTLWTRDDFYTECCGIATRLPNGNLLVSETETGTVYEITPGGSVAWKFVNPHNAANDEDKIARLHHVVRYDTGDLNFLNAQKE